MAEQPIRFDGAAYERLMDVWSQAVGTAFSIGFYPVRGQSSVVVGRGNGAFTEQFVQRSKPSEVSGVDPSESQLAFSRWSVQR
jgi:hypothetical protein